MKVKELMLNARLCKGQRVFLRDTTTATTFKTEPTTLYFGVDADEVERLINLDVLFFGFNDDGLIITA